MPRATLIAVVGLGLFYTFVSWMMIAGNGKAQSIEKANTDSIGLWVDLAEEKLGGAFVGDIYLFLIVIGSFACGLAFHNAASRYLYAIGRELPATANTLGAHARHAPHAAHRLGGAERRSRCCCTLGFYFLTTDGNDPLTGAYIYQYGLLAILGTMAILIVQAITSLAVIWYFHVKKAAAGQHPDDRHHPRPRRHRDALRRLAADRQHRRSPAARPPGSPFFNAIPWIVIGTFVLGLLGVLLLRARNRAVYDAIGRTVFEETHERV